MNLKAESLPSISSLTKILLLAKDKLEKITNREANRISKVGSTQPSMKVDNIDVFTSIMDSLDQE